MLRRVVGTSWKHKANEETESESSEESVSSSSREDEDEEEPDEYEETWVEWVVRATGIAEAVAKAAKVTDWVVGQRGRKWEWAGHIARRTDGRWGRKLLEWKPEGGSRRPGRPVGRWADSIEKYIESVKRGDVTQQCWIILAQDRRGWAAL